MFVSWAGSVLSGVVVGVVVGLVVGLILWVVKRKRTLLEYDLVESEAFPLKDGEARYFVLKINNVGNTPIVDTSLTVSFETGEIQTVRFSDKNLLRDLTQTPSLISGTIPLLNPAEVLSVTITSQGTVPIATPKIVARAVGVTATRTKTQAGRNDLLQWTTSIASFVLGLGLAGFVVFNIAGGSKELDSKRKIFDGYIQEISKIKQEIDQNQKKFDQIKKEDDEGNPTSREQVFAILNKEGLGYSGP